MAKEDIVDWVPTFGGNMLGWVPTWVVIGGAILLVSIIVVLGPDECQLLALSRRPLGTEGCPLPGGKPT
jgi:hypothetical protein